MAPSSDSLNPSTPSQRTTNMSNGDAEEWCKSDHILIDRANPRHKADRYLEYDTQLESVWKRLTIDIADLDFSKVETNPKKSMVWFSKHLCGCATDLTLKCAENYQKLKSDESQPVELIIIALCCHNRCTWDDFVGKEFFLEMGLDQSDFEIICKLASWAVSSKSSKNEEKEKEKEKTENQVEMSEIKREELIEDPEQIGIWAKRVIDYCRVKYFREQGFDVNLVHYVDFSVTPENTMLVATRRK